MIWKNGASDHQTVKAVLRVGGLHHASEKLMARMVREMRGRFFVPVCSPLGECSSLDAADSVRVRRRTLLVLPPPAGGLPRFVEALMKIPWKAPTRIELVCEALQASA
jgi:hypothetical protein